MLKRLTVHLENVKPERVKTGFETKPGSKKEAVKVILTNTISVHNLKSQAAINLALNDIRSNHTIATYNKPNHKTWKPGDEMWYTSNEQL